MKDGVSGFGVGHKMKCRGITVWGKSLGNESSLYFLRAVDVKNKTKKTQKL